MTVSYNESFLLLLRRWKGSLWKCIWKDLIAFLVLYYAVQGFYRLGVLNGPETMRSNFEALVGRFRDAQDYIPITFLLGFFVTQVIKRWWDQFLQITWPDDFMLEVAAYLPGDENRNVRKTLARWCNLTSVLAWKIVSVKTLKRFPNVKVLTEAGLMTPQEAALFESAEAPYGKFWLPNIWMINLIKKCYQEGRLSGLEMAHLIEEINRHRGGLKSITLYDWISLPLVYTQVATMATYGYFSVSLIGRQLLVSDEPLYFPVLTTLEFLFYMGWLKVAEELINPFGEDDQDFEMNHILDRNINVSYLIAEYGSMGPGPPFTDPHSGIKGDCKLPHTKASLAKGQDKGYSGHLSKMKFSADAMAIVYPKGKSPRTARKEPPAIEMSTNNRQVRHRGIEGPCEYENDNL